MRAFFCMLCLIVWQLPAAQASSGRLLKALDAWDMPRAATLAAALQSNDSQSAEGWLALGRWSLMEGRYGEAVEHLTKGLSLRPTPRLTRTLGLARAAWETTRNYATYTTSGGHFQVRYPAGRTEIMLPYVDQVLESALAQLAEVFDHRPVGVIRVEIYPESAVLAAVSPLTLDEIKTSGTIALCKYNRLMIVSPEDLVYGYGWGDTLSHELIHLLISQKSGNKVPIWLHEGFARYYQERWRSQATPRLSRVSQHLLAEALDTRGLISFEEMSPSMAKLPSQDATALAFAEVFTVIDFFAARSGDAVARQLPGLMRGGLTDRQAVVAASGLEWPRFESEWKKSLTRKGFRKMSSAFRPHLLFRGDHSQAEELAQLTAKTTRQWTWLGDQLSLRKRWKAAAKEYRKASMSSQGDSPIVQAKWGQALVRLGRLAEATAAMTKLARVYPDYVLLQLYLGKAWWMRGDAEKAREHAENVLFLNPFDPEVHGLLAQIYAFLHLDDLAKREKKAHTQLQTH